MVSTRRSRDLKNPVKDEKQIYPTAEIRRADSDAVQQENADEEAPSTSRRSVKVSSTPNGDVRGRKYINHGHKYAWESRKKIARTREEERPVVVRRSLRRNAVHFDNLDESYMFYQVQQSIYPNHDDDDAGKRRKEKTEVRKLLAAQGKDMDNRNIHEEPDIYSSVKSRVRVSTRTNRYSDFLTGESSRKKDCDEGSQSDATEEEDEEEEEDNEDEDDEELVEVEEHGSEPGHRYRLRKVREAPQRYTTVHYAPRRRPRSIFEALPCSPARRRNKRSLSSSRRDPYIKRRRRVRTHLNSSTDSSSDDEMKFHKRQKKSMDRARNECMPVNLSMSDIAKHSYAGDRKRVNSTLTADIDPMAIDTSVKFSSVGGHGKHIKALKEMVVFPLRYPEVFQKFKVSPPRGCLFYGPPGTGKTLMARALANECSGDGRKVAFFMKKGADCLSKWVGESERQLRILFDQAYQMRPAIIFFDEIDGLAPVRSSRQDQIHSSIVSTLLALMDGLDNRGEITVIGATNRIDSIDPALRRPGRFDREFQFPLPDKEARASILKIHTSEWDPPLKPTFVDYLASKTVGYCGADLRALCAEASLVALRRRYPQIYETSDKLQIDVDSISIEYNDFKTAIQTIIPSSQRSAGSPGRALSAKMKPLLLCYLKNIVQQLAGLFPQLKAKSKILQSTATSSNSGADDQLTWFPPVSIYSNETDEDVSSVALLVQCNGESSNYSNVVRAITSEEQTLITVYRPRMLVCGESGAGFLSHVVPALLHDMEGVPIHCLDLASMYGTDVRTPEEACAQVFREAKRVTPSVIYLSNADKWCEVASQSVQSTVFSLLRDIPSDLPILFLASSSCDYRQLPRCFSELFHTDFQEVYESRFHTTAEQRRVYFAPIFLLHAVTPPARKTDSGHVQERLEVAKAPEPAPLTAEEVQKLERDEESVMRNLRLFLRDVLMRLERDRRFKIFLKPVDFEEVPDYAQVIKNPMDFATMETKIDQHKYHTAKMFLADIDLICNNALEYNPDRRPEDKLVRHRACAMRDLAHAIVDSDLEPQFEKRCLEILESQKRRGVDPERLAPKYQRVLPKHLAYDPATGDLFPKPAEELEAKKCRSSEKKTPSGKNSGRKSRGRSSWSRGIIKTPNTNKKRLTPQDDELGSALLDPDTSAESGVQEQQNGVEMDETEQAEENTAREEVEEKLETNDLCDDEAQTEGDAAIEGADNVPLDDVMEIGVAVDAEMAEPMPEAVQSPPRRMSLRCRKNSRSVPDKVELPPPPPFIVDRAKFLALLEKVVSCTQSFSLIDLEKFHAILSRCIDKHKMRYNRSALAVELELEIARCVGMFSTSNHNSSADSDNLEE